MAINTSYNNLLRYIHFKPALLSEDEVDIVRVNASKREKRGKRDKYSPSKEKNEFLKLRTALKDLRGIDLLRDVDIDSDENSPAFNAPTTLKKQAISKLSPETKEYLASKSIDPAKLSYTDILDTLHSNLVYGTINKIPEFTYSGQQPANGAGYIQAVGTAQLLVVKQQIKRYEASEIAHIENILSGEKKVRTHDLLTRTEEFYSSVSEKTAEKENELESTERFELNKQVSKTLQKDTEMGLELSVSGKYGPTVSFEGNFNLGQNTSEATATENATSYAKETIERSKERIVEKLAITQERTLIREIRETNKHILENDSQNNHKFAIYQYVDKIYESQVFDYGKRQMFDFMIPEPSSYLWYLKENTPYELDLAEPLDLKSFGINEIADINKYNYQTIASYYKVSDLPEPPQLYRTRKLRLSFGTGAESDEGKFKSGTSGELEIPPMYQPNLATISILATSDEDLHFSLNIGGKLVHFPKSGFSVTDVAGGHKRYSLSGAVVSLGHDTTLANGEKLFVDLYGYESANYYVHLNVRFYAIYDQNLLEYTVVNKWKQEVFGKLSEAYQNMMLQFQQEKAVKEAEAEARNELEVDFDAPPSVYQKMIHTELKKHCLALIRNEHPGTFNTIHTGEPPQFDITDAKEDGEVIRFLEHAFEWSQLQYVLYPYFWARPDDDQKGWINRILSNENDFSFNDFLQAGYARVVVPVREGFDAAVSYFIEKGQVFNDLGEPELDDPLYISIVEEIKERTGAGKDEIPVGDAWETRLPTSAVIVRRTDTLPEWTKKAGEDWTWEPVP